MRLLRFSPRTAHKWLVCLTLLVGVLLPAWQSLGPLTGDNWGMVCSSAQASPNLLTAPTPGNDAPAAHTPSCPYCLLQHLAAVLPPQALALAAPGLAQQPRPPALTPAQRPRASIWLRPPAHAPPHAWAPAASALAIAAA